MSCRELPYPFMDLFNDLNRVFKDVLTSEGHTNRYDAMRVAVNKPSCRFWVSPERLVDVINAIEKGGNARVGRNSLRHEMFMELYRRYVEYRDTHGKMKKLDVCYEIVFQQAPKFYLKPSWGLKILNKGKTERKRRHHLRKQE